MNGPLRARNGRLVRSAALLLVGTFAVTACNDDGRTLRPARPDQVASVSTTSEPSTEFPSFDTGVVTLPAEPTTTLAAPTTTTTLAPPTTGGLATDSTTPGTGLLTTSWRDGAPIDARYTCDGANLSPALRWSTPPAETIEIAITMIDEDAPGFVHWAMAGIDPLSTSLGEGQVPEFALLGRNSTGELGYTGPCPPSGSTHRYVLTVHFLDQQTELPDGAPGADLLASIDERTLASATVAGVYSRS
jgi:Raf kinase inhibitor-like YbhB/YbcL family protein